MTCSCKRCKFAMLQSTVSTLAALAIWYALKYLIFTKPADFTWRRVLRKLKPCITVLLALILSAVLWRYNKCNHRIKTMASVLLIVAAISCAVDITRGAHVQKQTRAIIIPGHAACICVLAYLAGTSVLSVPVNACSVATSLSSVACIALIVAASL